MSGGRTNRFSSGSPVQFNSSHLVVDGCPESQAFLAKELLEIEIDKLKKHNDSLGVYWLVKASKQGHTEATEMLKNCLKTGKGITKRNIEDVMACLNNMTQKEKISARSTSLSQGIKTRSMSLICQIDIPLDVEVTQLKQGQERKMIREGTFELNEIVTEKSPKRPHRSLWNFSNEDILPIIEQNIKKISVFERLYVAKRMINYKNPGTSMLKDIRAKSQSIRIGVRKNKTFDLHMEYRRKHHK